MTSTGPSGTPEPPPDDPLAPVAGAGVCDRPAYVGPSPEEQAWFEAEAATIGFVSTLNTAVAGLVDTIAMLLVTEGWRGAGVRTCAHWVAWKAAMAPHRAKGLVAIAERRGELPACWAAFAAGKLTEDAMVLLARRVPAERDDELARLAPELTVAQLQRLVAKLPELSSDDGEVPEPVPYLRLHTTDQGWGRGSFHLPPDAMERFRIGLTHARDAEYHDRTGVDPHPDDPDERDDPDDRASADHPTDPDNASNGTSAGTGDDGRDEDAGDAPTHRTGHRAADHPATGAAHAPSADAQGNGPAPAGEHCADASTDPAPDIGSDRPGEPPAVDVSWIDALLRLVGEGTHALDPHHQRTGRPGERAKVVLHHDLDPHGTLGPDLLGPGRLHLGAVLPDPLARFLSCDADLSIATHRAGRLVGIHPTTRTVPTNLRRLIEDRDQGCTHPLCHQRRHLHIHHIWHWEHGGPTTPDNLLALCPTHHRQHHHGHFDITGDPEAGTIAFTTPTGIPLRPPHYGPTANPPDDPDPPEATDPPGDPDDPGPPPATGPRPPTRPGPPPLADAPYRPASGERLHTRWLPWN